MGVPHAQNKLFFSWLTQASAFVRCCLYSVYIIFSGSAHKVAAPLTLLMGG